MYSPQMYDNRQVVAPVLPNMSTPNNYYSNNFSGPLFPPVKDGTSFYPPYGNNNGPNPAAVNNSCSINALVSVPPPGYNRSGNMNQPPAGHNPISFSSNGFSGPLFNAPSFSGYPTPYTNPTSSNSNPAFPNFSVFQPPPNCSFAPQPMSFSVPPPPIPPQFKKNADDSRSKFPVTNSRLFHKNQPKAKLHCESCDRDFLNEEKFKQHVSEHVTCGIEGCGLTTHPKILEKHILMQHRTGLFNRIVKGNSPEEIEKWISERKKQYPTKNRIDLKQAQKDEMNKRGECYSEPMRKFNNRFSNDNRRMNGFNKFGNRRHSVHNKRRPKNSVNDVDQSNPFCVKGRADNSFKRKQPRTFNEEEEEEDCHIRNLMPFLGTAYYSCEDNVNDDDEIELEKTSFTSVISDDSMPSKNYLFDDCNCDSDSNDAGQYSEPTLSKSDISELCDENNCESVDVISSVNGSPNSRPKCKILKTEVTSAPEVKPVAQPASSSLDLLKIYDFSGDESESNEVHQVSVPNIRVSNPTSDDSGPEECSSKVISETENVTLPAAIITSNEAANAEEKVLKKNRKRKKPKDDEEKTEKLHNDEEKQNVSTFSNNKRYRPPTLLEKLLSNEIKHERNVILQCVRYVVENDYFDVD